MRTFVDAFRAFHPARPQAYTCWSTATAARVNNHGARIDLTLAAGIPVLEAGAAWGTGARGVETPAAAAPSAAPPLGLCGADIAPHVLGSDHCPVWVELAGPGAVCAETAPPGAARHAFPDKQVTLKDWLKKGVSGCRTPGPGPGEEASVAGDAAGAKGSTQNAMRPMPKPGSGKRTTLKAFFTPQMPDARPAAAGGRPAAMAMSADGVTDPLEATPQPSHFQPAAAQSMGSSPVAAGGEQGAQPPTSSHAVGFLAAEQAAARDAHDRHLAAAREAWSRINGRMAAPRCRHGEPTALKKANKTGENRGKGDVPWCVVGCREMPVEWKAGESLRLHHRRWAGEQHQLPAKVIRVSVALRVPDYAPVRHPSPPLSHPRKVVLYMRATSRPSPARRLQLLPVGGEEGCRPGPCRREALQRGVTACAQ